MLDQGRRCIDGDRLTFFDSGNLAMPIRSCLCCSFALLTAACAFVFSGCSGDEPFRKETYPVTGQVFVDGKPASGVAVKLFDVNGVDKEHPTFSQGMTDDEGRFAISTYEAADGVPVGEYVVTFEWGEMNMFTMQYGGPDKLKKKYSNPQKSQFRITVKEGEPTDMGRIDLTAK